MLESAFTALEGLNKQAFLTELVRKFSFKQYRVLVGAMVKLVKLLIRKLRNPLLPISEASQWHLSQMIEMEISSIILKLMLM